MLSVIRNQLEHRKAYQIRNGKSDISHFASSTDADSENLLYETLLREIKINLLHKLHENHEYCHVVDGPADKLAFVELGWRLANCVAQMNTPKKH